MGEEVVYPLDQFAVDELVLARNVNREEPFWPAIVVDPAKQAPERVRRQMQPDRLCVMFYGPAANKVRPRDFCWAQEGDVLPLSDYLDDLQSQHAIRKDRDGAFTQAIEEVHLVEAGFREPLIGAMAADRERLYAKDKYCRVCDKVWMPTDKNMVGCDECDFWIHDHCDEQAKLALKNTSSDKPYFCPVCRGKREAAGKLAALNEAQAALTDAQPRKPSSAYKLFASEIQKQYSRDAGRGAELRDLSKVVGDTWRGLRPKEREHYEQKARKETARYLSERRQYDDLQRMYTEMHSSAFHAGLLEQKPELKPNKGRPPKRPAEQDSPAPSAKRPAPSGPSRGPPKIPAKVRVLCGTTHGLFMPVKRRVQCECEHCLQKPESQREFSPTQFEAHCGAGAAKKWKASLRIIPGGAPDVSSSGNPVQIGRWLVSKGLEKSAAKPSTDDPAISDVSGQESGAVSGMSGHFSTADGPLRPSAKPNGRAAGKTTSLLSRQPSPSPSAALGLSSARDFGAEQRAEKASTHAPWLSILLGEHQPIKVRWAGDRCSICDSDMDFDFDQLVSCDMCGITVHQSCYGVPELPGVDDMWLCRACELKEEGKPTPQCCLCPIEGGALKPTTVPSLWCHAACMQWIPEVTVDNVSLMEPVSHITAIQKERWDLL
ncbi:hypothetical protein WJX84_009528, partial [Apatococcus fuscideae]